MQISFLILTHNRPKLFKRCIESIINQNFEIDIEILVNNDSNDIEEICLPYIKYYYNSSQNLSELYKHLYDKANGKYIYFIEDDDYILPRFSSIINKELHNNYDLFYMNYIPVDLINVKLSKFEIETKNHMFQLSQILFKKECVKNFPNDNHIHNDWNLFQNIYTNTKNIKLISLPMFKQTCDGKDNISFKEYNKDARFNI